MTKNNEIPEDLFAIGFEDEDISESQDTSKSSSDSGEYVLTERYKEPGELKEDYKEEIKNYQYNIKDLDYIKLLEELTNYTGKEEVFRALTGYLDKIKDKEEIYFGISGKDRFDSLSKEDKISCYKLEKLINQIILKYKEEGADFKFVNEEGKILKSLVQEVYDSFDVNLQGIESDIIKLITGYSVNNIKKIETDMEKDKLEQILNEDETIRNKVNSTQKVITYSSVLTPFAALAAYMFNLADAKDAVVIGTAIDASLVALLPFLSLKKYKISKEVKKLKNKIKEKNKMLEDLEDEKDINKIKYHMGL